VARRGGQRGAERLRAHRDQGRPCRQALSDRDGVQLTEDLAGTYDVIARVQAPIWISRPADRLPHSCVGRRHPHPDLHGDPAVTACLAPAARAAGRPLPCTRVGRGRGMRAIAALARPRPDHAGPGLAARVKQELRGVVRARRDRARRRFWRADLRSPSGPGRDVMAGPARTVDGAQPSWMTSRWARLSPEGWPGWQEAACGVSSGSWA